MNDRDSPIRKTDRVSQDPALTGSDWLERAVHWTGPNLTKPTYPNQRRNLRVPLLLTGHGISLCVNHGALVVRNGFTHYPQQQDEWCFFRGDQKRPSRIILLSCDGRTSLAALAWLSEQQIPLIQLDYRGRVVTVLGAAGHAASPELVQIQLASARNTKRAMAITSWLIREKINQCTYTLRAIVPSSIDHAIAIRQLTADATLLDKRPAKSKHELHGIEGRSAQFYFRSWYPLPIRWKGTSRHPIPADWHRIGPRTSARNQKNHWASHPVHAMLNYGYTVLESQVRTALVQAGFDPTIGFMHAMHPNRPALVLDVMEPARPIVDAVVLKFALGQIFMPADFMITPDGVCRLHPQLARRLVVEVGHVDGVARIVTGLVQKLAS